ncbi:Origin recognition complex subunit 2 [Escovopsis weberi]|uniref:Origin recognition complex subunit 2 n=1 Tax=Escovopsis weberi TaxID=150374 RepID=A0A0M9VU77_ESCWE|nr:Origin recognition complex subunit 2 [Escovopsis weberi]
MPTRSAAGGDDAPDLRLSEPRAQRERRPTRRAIAAAEFESAAPARRQGRSQARAGAANPAKTVVLDLEPVVMGNGRDNDDGHGHGDDNAVDEIHDVVMQDSELQPQDDAQAESESHTEPEHGKESEAVATPRRRARQVERRPKGGGSPSKAPASILKTPVKNAGLRPAAFTPGSAADRSARKKSARALLVRAMHDGASDDEHAGDRLAREIYESSDDDAEEEEEDVDDDNNEGAAATPSKRPRGRQAGQAKRSTGTRKKRARSPTPPRDLPRHETYFSHNKPGRPRTSDNTLSSLTLLTHDEYFAAMRGRRDRHAEDIAFLEALHAESFPQWAFELSQGFSVCLYGLGSKRALLRRFAGAVHARNRGTRNRIVMVNGYAPTTTLREVLSTVGAAVAGGDRGAPRAVPAGPPAGMARAILALLSAAVGTTLTLAIHSVDAPPLRKPGAQAVLARLAGHPRVHLVCTADTPDFPLLWDMGLRSAFNFVFHDCTTFALFRAEIDVVDQVHELLGRQAQRANGREGVAFVLKSLTENAKNLFRLLVGEVLVAMDDDDDEGAAGEDGVGLEYRMLYNKAVEEFICSSEMAFRTLLKEFHDHQMITSRKDALGTELLSLPFRKEDLEAILEDLSM